MHDGLVDSRTAAELLGITQNVIAQWRKRGKLEVADSIKGGRARGGLVLLYKLKDLEELADAYHRNRHANSRSRP